MRILWCCLFFSILICGDLVAQRADSPSHRLIPRKKGAQAPSLNDFMSPELKELADEYKRAMRERVNPKPNKPKQKPMLDSEQSGSVERFEQPSQRSAANDLDEEIRQVNEKMARKLDGPLSDTLSPNSIPLETNRNLIKDIGEMIKQGRREARQQYQQAMDAYKRVWPADGIPPAEWLKKVQPYINPELVKQLRDARNPQQQDPINIAPSGLKPQEDTKMSPLSMVGGPQKKKSRGIFDSLIGAIDKKGTQWLKTSKDKSATKKKKSSWWTALKSKTKQRMASMNKQVTQHSRKVNQQKATSAARPKSITASDKRASPTAIPAARAGTFLYWIVGVVTLAGLGYFAWHKFGPSPEETETSGALACENIQDRETLLRACNHLAWQCFGWPSRFWNHRIVFSKLGELASQDEVVAQLSELYEHARYAPRGSITSKDVELARKLFGTIRSQSLVPE